MNLVEGDTRDRRWWQRANWAVESQARADTDILDRMTFDLHCATVASGADPRDAWKAAVNVYDSVRFRLRPWETPEDRSHKPLEDLWKSVFGDPDSEETQAAINKTAEELLQRK